MLKKQQRITKNKEFDQIFKTGKSSYNKIIGIKIKGNDLEVNRFGIIVSNKVSKKAIERNKIKRQIRAVLRDYDSQPKTKHDYLVIALPPIMDKQFSEIETSIKKHLKKLSAF